jgi:sialate O-acetylesterase
MPARVLLIALIFASFAAESSAAVKPVSLFSDNAVLQQGVATPVWGPAADGERVTVDFQGQNVSTTARDGKWAVRLEPLKAGGPFTMTISGQNKLEIKNVLVGEVWVCSGQSNMVLLLSKVDDAEKEIAGSADPMLRL